MNELIEGQLLIQQPDADIEVCREGNPNKVWDKQVACNCIYLREFLFSKEDQAPQNDYPNKGEKIFFKVEEYYRPKEIKR